MTTAGHRKWSQSAMPYGAAYLAMMSWLSCWRKMAFILALISLASFDSLAFPPQLSRGWRVAYHPGVPPLRHPLPGVSAKLAHPAETSLDAAQVWKDAAHAVLLCTPGDRLGRPRRRRRRCGAFDGRTCPPALSAACMAGRETGEAGGAASRYQAWPGYGLLQLTFLQPRRACVYTQVDAVGSYQRRTTAARWVAPGKH